MSLVYFPQFPIMERHDVYPAIDPKGHYAQKTHQGKVVFITGASRGIGQEIAATYARAGASVALTARTQAALDAAKAEILSHEPSANVLTIAADVTQIQQVKAAVKAVIERFGRLDIVIANAGKGGDFERNLAEEDPSEWWDVVEVNLRGAYNVAHFALPHLAKVNGYIVFLSSGGALLRLPGFSSYAVAKHALNALVEFVSIEFPNVKTFAVHPGAIETDMFRLQNKAKPQDTLQLPAALALYITSGKIDWISGRFFSATWDIEELQNKYKDAILEKSGLVSRLHLPEP